MVDVVAEPLSLPLWFPTVMIVLIALGFAIAFVFGWIIFADIIDSVVSLSIKRH
ncbi:MAG: hypothetical protein ACI8RN_002197 [Glaciecola sp.]